MLERATACLKAGARDIPNRTHQATRSKPRLHSTFWNYGAGDLELPPWAVFVPAGLPPKPNSTSKSSPRRRYDGVDTTSTSASNDSFLDFLYPPQALAWLQHSSRQRWAQWERRNVKRLPKCCNPASRRYASSSCAQPAAAEAHLEQKKDTSHSSRTKSDAPDLDASHGDFEPLGLLPTQLTSMFSAKGLRSRSEAYKQSLQRKLSSVERSQAETDDLFADSPADLADSQEQDSCVGGLRGLRRLLQSGKRSNSSRDRVAHAWHLYMALAEDEKQDIRLKREMLAWLVKQDTESADAHCISLYWSLPPSARDLAVYQAACAAFLRRKHVRPVYGLHHEALSNIANGTQVTKTLFGHAMKSGDWRMALRVKEQLDEAFVEPAASRQQAMFWFDVAEQTNLLETAADFVSLCFKKHAHGHHVEPKLIRLALRLSEEALDQLVEQQLPVSKDYTRPAYAIGKVQRALRGIAKWSPRAQSIFEGAILSLLRRHESHSDYARAHPLVQYLYTQYRTFANTPLPQDMLMILLERLTQYTRNKPNLRTVDNGVLSIPMVVHDWKGHYEALSKRALHLLLGYYAASGDVHQVVSYFDSFRMQFPAYADQKSAFWYPIYVHARLCDPRNALLAFEEFQKLAAAQREQLDSKCWAILLHAFSRAHDTEGAFAAFRKMLDSGVQPTEYTFHPLTELLASMGDVEGVDELLQQFDTLTGERRTTSLAGSQMHACFNIGDNQGAEKILKQIVTDVRERKVSGSLTGCFNILITSYALKRDVNATMRVYRWMKSENVWMNEFTYSALMQALIHFRQTDAAKSIMLKVMPREGFQATALHYAIVMAGYNKQRLFGQALDTHAKMKENNVRDTLASRRAYLQAKAFHEQQMKNPTTADGQPAPLKEVIAELRAAIETTEGFDIAAKQPRFGYESSGHISAYLDSIMYIHSSRRCLEAVEAMFGMVQSSSNTALFTPGTPTLRLLTAFMQALYHAERYDEVEAFWKVAKQQADKIAAPPQVPDFTSTRDDGANANQAPSVDRVTHTSTANADQAEIGFGSITEPAQPELTSSPVGTRDAAVVVRPARGRRYILLGPLRQYMAALAKQNRIGDLVTTCTRLLQQGYAFDIIVWNRFVQYMCTSSPSLALLAFTLTERYMISKFPGWKKQTRHRPQRSARQENLQYIKARYLPREQVMPQYRTMLYLAAALIKLKRAETTRGRRNRREQGGLHRLVGTVRQIEERAPKTLAAVESMPNVDDKWQMRLLRAQQ
ncbi:hypothetical protein DOTSEDRAFT_69310 [Dothistroma septosporum NZE10]|uniref:Pentacotripeptide-repeat region of PRORP domain-containing protein n=1 Tax=Dothistroma septosporum (strain NZE10 / CBS 128990) TaxID=675120 RepID=N1PVE0_DOTSN|nr:hypothetical protein DOTSEDRAFT_69310 [Dothistroma septosporum NZE10]